MREGFPSNLPESNPDFEKKREVNLRKIRSIEINGKQVDVFEKDHDLIGLEELNRIAEENKENNGENAKKVLFIDFKTLGKMPANENYSFQNFVNLGLHRIEGYLKDYNVPATIARFSELKNDPNKLDELLQSHDIIGVSNLTGQVEETYALCREIKSRFGDEKLIVGGGEHYLAQDHILADQKTTGIDICCSGQGELPILALALGVPKEDIPSLSYQEGIEGGAQVVRNRQFQRLKGGATDVGYSEVLSARKSTPFTLEEVSGDAPFNELNRLKDFKFDGTFVTQTGSGCQFACDFCPSNKFFGSGYKVNFDIAKEEIMQFKHDYPEMKHVFLTFADAMLNPSVDHNKNHLDDVIKFMAQINSDPNQKISWFAYLSAPQQVERGGDDDVWRKKWDKKLAEMAAAGCIMVGVGVEEIIYDRNKTYHKGQSKDTASEFIDLAGKHMLTRSLLILGGPNQMYLERDKTLKGEEYHEKYESDRDLIKGEILEYMKAHPQALYRMNPWTLVYGTDDFYKYKDCLAVDITDPAQLKQLDHLHSVIDPKKMYAHIEKERGITIPEEKKWVTDKEVWFELMEEIMEEYLNSPEYNKYIETLKEKITVGKRGLLYEFAMKFKENALGQIASNRQQKRI